jgi:homoserine dehydrogenase
LQQHEISVESLVQQGRSSGEAVPLVMITHEASAAAIHTALTAFTALNCVRAKPVAMPILVDELEG